MISARTLHFDKLSISLILSMYVCFIVTAGAQGNLRRNIKFLEKLTDSVTVLIMLPVSFLNAISCRNILLQNITSVCTAGKPENYDEIEVTIT